ncbi:MAG TPA: ABC transporter [Deltaproteobacteria bacterium]|nr:ABC transporter [Deltaproteobacteria bacterium]
MSGLARERVRRVRALVLRYLLLLRRDPARVVDTFYWPLIDIAVWGLLTSFVAGRGARLPNAIGVFLGAAILWNLFFRCAQDVSVSFLDDVWSRSVVTIFASPLSFGEFAVAIMLLGLVKLTLTLAAMSVAAWLLYAFNLFSLGIALVPFAANLVLLGWSVGLVSLALILRFGGRWAIVAWSLPFLLMPFSSVFYPESVLPPVARGIARAIPANHVFEGMRSVVMDGRMDWGRLGWATTLNLLYLALAASVTAFVFRVALHRGLLPKVR